MRKSDIEAIRLSDIPVDVLAENISHMRDDHGNLFIRLSDLDLLLMPMAIKSVSAKGKFDRASTEIEKLSAATELISGVVAVKLHELLDEIKEIKSKDRPEVVGKN